MQRKANGMQRQRNGMEGNGMHGMEGNGRQQNGMEGKTDARFAMYLLQQTMCELDTSERGKNKTVRSPLAHSCPYIQEM